MRIFIKYYYIRCFDYYGLMEMYLKNSKIIVFPTFLFHLMAVSFFVLFFFSSAHSYERIDFLFQIGPELRGDKPGKLYEPVDAFMSADGTIYVVDSDADRIITFDESGAYKGAFGSKGSEPGKFNEPTAITQSKDGRLFVVDSGNNRIQVFNTHGQFLYSFGKGGDERGEVDEPGGIAIDSQERVMITDRDNYSIVSFTLDGIYLGRFGKKGDKKGAFLSPADIAVDSLDNIYVSDDKNENIQVFDYDLNFKRLIKKKSRKDKSFGLPLGLALDKWGALLYTDVENSKIHRLDRKGEEVFLFGSEGSGRGQFSGLARIRYNRRKNLILVTGAGNSRVQVFRITPEKDEKVIAAAKARRRLSFERIIPHVANDMAMNDKGEFYLVQSDKRKILVLDKEGKVVSRFGKAGKGKSLFDLPHSIMLTPLERLYISDVDNHKIHVFDTKGKKLFHFGGKGRKEGNLREPRGLAFYKDNLYVADSDNHRVQIFNKDGIFLKSIGKEGDGAGRFDTPYDIAVNSRGEIWVADYNNSRIQVFDKNGKFLKKMGKKGMKAGQFYRPRSISIDADNLVYVLDGEEGARIQVFNDKGKYLYSLGSPGKGNPQLMDARNIYVHSNEGSRILVADKGNKVLKVLFVKQVPSVPSPISLAGNEAFSRLTWEAAGESFVAGYKVYARGLKEEEYSLLGASGSAEFEVKHDKGKEKPLYVVSAYSFGGLESEFSKELKDDFRLGYAAFEGGDFKGAIIFFEKVLSTVPEDPKALLYAGHAFSREKEYIKASEKYKALSRVKGHEKEGALQLGLLYMNLGEHIDAEKIFSALLKKDPAFLQAKRYMGEILFEKGLYSPALEMLNEVAEKGLKDARIYNIMGKIYLKSSVLNKAEKAFNDAIKLNPHSAELYRNLAAVSKRKGKVKGAIEKLNKAISLDSKDIESYLNLAELYIEAGKLEHSEKVINSALQISPDSADVNYIKGRLMTMQKRYEDAVLSYGKALTIDKEHEKSLFYMAMAYMEMGRRDEAVSHFKKAISFKSSNPLVYLAISRLYEEENKLDEAIRRLKQCVDKIPDDSQCHELLAQLYLKKNKPEKSEKHLAKVVQISPQKASARIKLASVLKGLGKTGEALVQLEAAISLDDAGSEARHLLGTIYLESKQLTKALRELEMAVKLEAGNAAYHNSLGLAYLELSRPDEAIEAFKRAYNISAHEVYKANLNAAFEKKTQLAASSDGPPVEIVHISFSEVFASAYKSYEEEPLGTISLRNNSDEVLKNIKVSLNIKKYMDFPSEQLVKSINPHETVKLDIKSTFNNALLQLTEDTSVQAEISVQYFKNEKTLSFERRESLTIYNRNAMTWSRKEMAAAFVTPKDAPVVTFARGVIQMVHGESPDIDMNMGKAIQLFDALGVSGVVYVVDPNNPYASVSTNNGKVDSIQYPRHTLKHKTGDCDDLVVLYSALLENLGVETVMLDIPGHLFMAFKTGIKSKDAKKLAGKENLYIIRDEYVWIPVEVTMVGKSFTEAWREGAKEMVLRKTKGELNIIDTHGAWGQFKPVSIEDKQEVSLPGKNKLLAAIREDIFLQQSKGIEKLIKPYVEALKKDPENYKARLNLGIIYGKKGYYENALREFEGILKKRTDDPHTLNNIGNVYFEEKKYEEAVKYYQKAESSGEPDSALKLNLSLAYYKMGKLEKAKAKFREGERLSPEIAERFSIFRSILFD